MSNEQDTRVFTDYVDFGSAPTEEDCAQVGREGYTNRAITELLVLGQQLYREFPRARELLDFMIQRHSHDFGHYYGLRIWYDKHNQEAVDLIEEIQENFPERWDEVAIKEIYPLA